MRRSLVVVLAGCLLVVTIGAFASAQVPASQTGAARALPSTVLNAFQKAYPNAEITGSSQERQDGKIAFRVEAQDKGRHRVLLYDLTGSVIEAAEQVSEGDLPEPVVAAMRQQAHATYVKGMKVTRGLMVHYELTLRGTRKTTMVVKPDGAVVSFK